MLVKHHTMSVATTLRREIAGITRVLVARTDGLSFHDDASDGDEGPAAVAAATVLAVAHESGNVFGLGQTQVSVVRGSEGCCVVYPIDDRHLLGILTEPSVNLVLLDRIAQRLARELAAAESGAAVSRFP